jgi:hypothetical protein
MEQNKKLEQLKHLVEDFYGIDIELKIRTTVYVQARSIYYYLCREFTSVSVVKIGQSIGKNHATVLHALKELPYIKKFDSNFKKNFYELYEIAKNLNEEKPKELTIEELVHQFNKLQLDYQILKTRLSKYEQLI